MKATILGAFLLLGCSREHPEYRHEGMSWHVYKSDYATVIKIYGMATNGETISFESAPNWGGPSLKINGPTNP